MRIDKYLYEYKYCDSRAKAQEMLASGVVFVNGKLISKPSHQIADGDEVKTTILPQHKYASRAGYKLEQVLKKISLSPEGLKVLDIGQSTGGFTDCLLQLGAQKVTGIDVGTDQLHENLKNHNKIDSYENINAKDLLIFLKEYDLEKAFDLVVMDLSFISMTKIVPLVSSALAKGGQFLSLVKPQFELGKKALNSKGVVKDIELYRGLENKIREVMRQEGFQVLEYLASDLEGKSGNKEFFVYATKS